MRMLLAVLFLLLLPACGDSEPPGGDINDPVRARCANEALERGGTGGYEEYRREIEACVRGEDEEV